MDRQGESDYFNYTHSSVSSSDAENKVTEQAPSASKSTSTLFKSQSRNTVQAGDLHSSTSQSGETYRPLSRSFSILNTPLISRGSLDKATHWAVNLSGDEFDLREEVMSCIAKSIGLLQPPLSGSDSVEASPAFFPADSRQSPGSGTFSTPFSSLSLLDLGDDLSSMTGASSAIYPGDFMSGLDNEVEMLYFAAGSTLAKAGELNTGSSTFCLFGITPC